MCRSQTLCFYSPLLFKGVAGGDDKTISGERDFLPLFLAKTSLSSMTKVGKKIDTKPFSIK